MQNKNNLPKNAKLKFKGEIFEVWQWEQKMFDSSIEIFEKLKRPDTAQVIPVVGDKILIQKQKQPDSSKLFFSIPGGRCDLGEKPLNTAKREFLEETGYASKNWQLWKKQNPVKKIVWTVYTYIARDCFYKQPPRLDAGEKIATQLIDFEKFLTLSEDPNFYESELKSSLLRARFDKKFRKEFWKLLFGPSS